MKPIKMFDHGRIVPCSMMQCCYVAFEKKPKHILTDMKCRIFHDTEFIMGMFSFYQQIEEEVRNNMSFYAII